MIRRIQKERHKYVDTLDMCMQAVYMCFSDGYSLMKLHTTFSADTTAIELKFTHILYQHHHHYHHHQPTANKTVRHKARET